MKSINKRLKEEALKNSINDPKVYAQVQKNTEKILNKREKETFMMAKAAIKELLFEKYDDMIKTAIYEAMNEMKTEVKEAVKET